MILTGAHGYDERDYHAALGTDRTLVGRFSVVGDVVQNRRKGPPQDEQIAAIERLVASIALLR